MKAAHPELYRRYQYGTDATVTKTYSADTLTPAQKAMAELLADSARTKLLGSWKVDHLARQQLISRTDGVVDSLAEYKKALGDVRSKNPSLAEAENSGYIAADDWQLLMILIPANRERSHTRKLSALRPWRER